MPIWRVTSEKYAPALSEYWTNVYHVDFESMDDALTAARAIVAAERACTFSVATFTKFRIDDGIPNTAVWTTEIINAAGLLDPEGGDIMPLFVVGRVDLSVVGGGRPSRKYMRAALGEGECTMTSISSGAQGRLANFAAALADAGACDPQGQAVITGAPWPAPAMRQLRRGSKKRVTP